MSGYEPAEPRILQSGKHAGSSLEILMFRDYSYLSFLLRKINEKWIGGSKADFHLHLEWLLDRGEDRQTVALCPFCRMEKVKYFSVLRSRSGLSVGRSYISCEKCIDELKKSVPAEKQIEILPFRFSVLDRFWRGRDQKTVIDVFLLAFGLSERRLKTDTLFNLFNGQEQGAPSTTKV